MNVDPEFTKVSLLLPFDSVSTFSDKSYRTKTLTRFNVTMSTVQKVWTTQSAFFDSWQYYFTLPQNEEFDFGVGDFCIEFWFYSWTSTPSSENAFLSCNNSTYVDGCARLKWGSLAQSIALFANVSGVDTTIIQRTSFPHGVWNYITLSRSGNTFRFFRDGILLGASATYAGPVNFSIGGTNIGRRERGDRTVYGWMQDLRITKGAARYVENFWVPQRQHLHTTALGSIGGTVYELTNSVFVPGSYPVRVCNRETGEVYHSVNSNESGAYLVEGVWLHDASDNLLEYYVVAIDQTAPILTQSAIVDKVVPT
jgi:hypothetical protein